MYKNKTIIKNFVLFCFLSVFMASALFVPWKGIEAQTLPKISDPLNLGSNGIIELIGRIIKAVMGILGALSLAILFYGGFTLLTSSGRSEWIKKGWEVLRYGFIGLAVVFFSYTFLNYVFKGLSGQAEKESQVKTEIRQEQTNNCLDNCVSTAEAELSGLGDLKTKVFDYCMETSCSNLFNLYNQDYRNETEENIKAQIEAAEQGEPTEKTVEELKKILDFLYCRDECQFCLESYQPPAIDTLKAQSAELCAEKIDLFTNVCSVDFKKSVLDFDGIMAQYCPLVSRKITCVNTCKTTMKRSCVMQCDVTLAELSAEPFSAIEKYKNGVRSGYCGICCQNFVDEECKTVIPPDCTAYLKPADWKNMMNTYCDATTEGEKINQKEYASACKLSCQTKADAAYKKDCYSNCFQQFKDTLKDAWGRTKYCETDCCKPLAETALAADYAVGDAVIKLTSSQFFQNSGTIRIGDDFISYTSNNRGRGELTIGSQEGSSNHFKGDKAVQSDESMILYSYLTQSCNQYDTLRDDKCQYAFSGTAAWPTLINQYCPTSTNLFKQGCADSCKIDVEKCQSKCLVEFSGQANAADYCKTSCCTADRIQTAKNSCVTIVDPDNKKCEYDQWEQFFDSCPVIP